MARAAGPDDLDNSAPDSYPVPDTRLRRAAAFGYLERRWRPAPGVGESAALLAVLTDGHLPAASPIRVTGAGAPEVASREA